MSTAVNKKSPDGDPAFADFHVKMNANTPDFPTTFWVINSPNLTALIGTGSPGAPQIPKRYWIVDNPTNPATQNLREMTPAEKAVVDADSTQLSTARSKRKGEIAAQAEAFLDTRYLPIQREAFGELMARGPAVGDRAVLYTYIDWLTTYYVGLASALTSVDAAATVPAVEAVSFNTAPFVSSDPLVTLPTLVPAKKRLSLGFVAIPMLANTTVTNATTNIDGPLATAPANSLDAEMVFKLTWYFAFVHTAAATPTVIAEMLIGGAVVATLTVTPPATALTYAGRGEAVFSIRTAGSSGTLVGSLFTNFFGTTAAQMFGGGIVGTGTTAINTTVSNVVQIRMRMGTAVASNTLTISQGWLDRLN